MDDNNLLQPQQLDAVQAGMQKEAEKAKEAEATLASVVVTPAWEEVKKLLEDKASDKTIVNRLRPAAADPKVSNAELGEMCRVAFISADEISNTLTKVLETVKAHEK